MRGLTECSECGGPLKRRGRTGPWPKTCSPECTGRRKSRVKKAWRRDSPAWARWAAANREKTNRQRRESRRRILATDPERERARGRRYRQRWGPRVALQKQITYYRRRVRTLPDGEGRERAMARLQFLKAKTLPDNGAGASQTTNGIIAPHGGGTGAGLG